jgi:hypothetical protein
VPTIDLAGLPFPPLLKATNADSWRDVRTLWQLRHSIGSSALLIGRSASVVARQSAQWYS